MRKVTLTPDELGLLDQQSPGTESDGGFQSLLVAMQGQVNRQANEITLSDDHEERIARYAFDYRNGGWQNRLVGIFGRTMGQGLGR
jgi:hypothetical protein